MPKVAWTKKEGKEDSPGVKTKPAKFITPHRSLVLWYEAPLEIQTPTGSRRDPNTGKAITFSAGFFETDDLERIEWLIDHKGFEVDFFAFPEKDSYWEQEGYFKRETEEKLTPTDKVQKIKKTVAEDIEAMAKEAGVQTVRQKGSD